MFGPSRGVQHAHARLSGRVRRVSAGSWSQRPRRRLLEDSPALARGFRFAPAGPTAAVPCSYSSRPVPAEPGRPSERPGRRALSRAARRSAVRVRDPGSAGGQPQSPSRPARLFDEVLRHLLRIEAQVGGEVDELRAARAVDDSVRDDSGLVHAPERVLADPGDLERLLRRRDQQLLCAVSEAFGRSPS